MTKTFIERFDENYFTNNGRDWSNDEFKAFLLSTLEELGKEILEKDYEDVDDGTSWRAVRTIDIIEVFKKWGVKI
jgi:hypothetical protein